MPDVTMPDESTLNTQLIQPKSKTLKERYEEFKNSNIKTLLSSVRWMNFFAGLVVTVFSLFIFFSRLLQLQVNDTIISGYCFIFAGILTLYELHLKKLNRRFRLEYGFLFTYIGRACYVFFIATILLSLWDFVTFILSMIFFALAVMNLGVIVFHPAFHRRELTIFDDPTVSYSSGDNEIKNYMVKNPELAQKVLVGAAKLSV